MKGINTTGPTDFAAAVTAGLKAGEAGPAVGGRRRPSVSAHCAGRPAGQHRRGPAGYRGRAVHRRLGPPGSLTQTDPEPGQGLAAWLRIFWMASQLQAGTMLNNLSDHELWTGDPDAACRRLAEALDIARALNACHSAVLGTFNLGLAEYLPPRSVGPHGAADQAPGDLGHVLQPLETRLGGPDRQRLRAAMATGAFDAEYAEGHTLGLVRAAHQALQGLQARPRAAHAGSRASEQDAALSGEAATVLTPRERDVLKLVAQGLSNLGIAQQLFLSKHTAHRHLANILRKLNLSSRAAAAVWGVRAGLV